MQQYLIMGVFSVFNKKHSLSRRFFALVLFCSFMAFAATIGVEMWINYCSGIREIKKNIVLIQNSYLPALAAGLFSVDENQLRILLKGMLNLEGIVFCEVIEASEGTQIRIFEGDSGQIVDKGHVFDLTYRSTEGDVIPFGTLTVYTNDSNITGQLLQSASVEIILFSLLLFLSAVVIMISFQRTVARHLFKMAEFAQGIDLTHLDTPLKLQRPARQDELEQVVTALNTMQAQLKQDMAERNIWQEALQAEKDLTQRVIETSPAGIVRVAVDGRIVYTNRLAEKILGIKLSDDKQRAYNDPDWRITALDGGPFPEKQLPFVIVKNSGRPVVGIRHAIEWPNGKRVLLSINASPFFNSSGQFDGMVAAIEDITDLYEAQRTLKESRERVNTILESIHTGIIIIDPESHNIVEVNSAAVAMIGDAKDNIIGKTCTDYICPSQSDVCPITDLGRTIDHSESLLFNGKHETIPILKTVSPIMINGKKHLLESFVDIAERKHLEAQLQQAQKMESIGNLAGGIAHDFNNLLFPIIGIAELLMDDLPHDSPEWHQVREIFSAGQRGSELVKQILAFSRQTEYQPKPIRIQKVLTELLSLCRSTIPANIKIVDQIQKDCGLIMGDATQLHQVAMNLITNAYHALDGGNGTITVTLNEIEIKTDESIGNSLAPGGYVQLSVADTGRGMDLEVINKIFDPYFTTKARGKGTGLGLSVTYGIVKNYHGDIKVESTPDKGTVFKVFFPLAERTAEASAVEPAETIATGKERILLVDDEASVANLERLILERLGYRITARTSSIDALNTFKTDPDAFDLVISDMTMPDMTGDELAQKLLDITPNLPIIICTGFSERMDPETAVEKGIKGLLMKPVVKAELAGMIRKVLD